MSQINSANIHNSAAVQIEAPAAHTAPAAAPAAEENILLELPEHNIAQQAKDVKNRIDQLLTKVAASGTQGLSGSLYENISNDLHRPHAIYKKRLQQYEKIMESAQLCDTAAKKLSNLTINDILKNFPSEQDKDLNSEQDEALNQFQAPDPALDPITEYVEAQNKLYADIQAFYAVKGKKSPLLDSLLQATQFRACEAINLMGMMQQIKSNTKEGNALLKDLAPILSKIDPEKSILRGLQGISHKMHHHVLADKLGEIAADLFKKIEKLEKKQHEYTCEDFLRKTTELKNEVEKFNKDISEIPLKAAAPEAQINDPQIQIDKSFHQALQAYVNRMETSLDSMVKNSNPREQLCKDAEELLIKYDLNIFDQIKTSDTNIINQMLEKLKNSFSVHNNEIEKLQNTIRSDYLGLALQNKITTAMDRFRNNELLNFSYKFYTLYQLTKKINNNEKDYVTNLNEIIRNVFKSLPNLPDKEISKISKFLMENKDNKAFILLGEYCSSITFLRPSLFKAQAAELATMYKNASANDLTLHPQFILEALEQNVNITALLEAKMRNIPLNQLETLAGDANLVSSKVLGQGAANTVSLCTYQNTNGEKFQLVFKPEVAARRGLAGLRISSLGYKENTRVMQINIASCRSAEAIGCENVIAKSKIGSFEGKIGLFMEAAKGATVYDIIGKKAKCGINSKGETFNFNESIQILKKNNLLHVMQASLMKELCKLEWADILSGQGDRHGDNYLVSIDTDTGKVTVTGIDNDASFGAYKIGMNKIRLTPKDNRREFAMSFGGSAIKHDNILDTSKLTSYQLQSLKEKYGFNQLFVPTHIDRETYDKLMAINIDVYRKSLSECLDSDAVESAVLRLKDAQDHARYLDQVKRVVDNWESKNVFQEYRREYRGNDTGSYLRMGFFARDFLNPMKKQ